MTSACHHGYHGSSYTLLTSMETPHRLAVHFSRAHRPAALWRKLILTIQARLQDHSVACVQRESVFPPFTVQKETCDLLVSNNVGLH